MNANMFVRAHGFLSFNGVAFAWFLSQIIAARMKVWVFKNSSAKSTSAQMHAAGSFVPTSHHDVCSWLERGGTIRHAVRRPGVVSVNLFLRFCVCTSLLCLPIFWCLLHAAYAVMSTCSTCLDNFDPPLYWIAACMSHSFFCIVSHIISLYVFLERSEPIS